MSGWFRGLILIVGWSLLQGMARASESEQPVDPMRLILQRAIEAMDESYDSWNFRPQETVDSTTFTINYIASLSTDGQKRLDRVMILHVDPNRDRMVTRDEAMRFLETQLGIRWVTGDRLRFDDGRVVDFAGFLRADTDGNDEISEQEFVVAVWDRDGAKADFAAMDADGNGAVTLSEYASPDGPNIRNMVESFERADVDGDGGLSERELLQVTPINRRHLVRSNLVAFDDDGDQQLSLTEFRISMLGNFNYPWETLPQDENHDDAISFEEFQFHPRDLFQLQKRYYFHRLDGNGDDRLTIDEFDFEQQKSYSLYRISRGGEEIKEIYQNDRYPIVGAPSISKDGQSILVHAIPPQGEHKALVVVMSADGKETREICHGLMPSWAPESGRFACSRYQGGAGVWIMRTDGNAEHRIDDGWGAQWSPDGRSIAYTNDNSIRVYDVSSHESRIVLAKQEHPYRYVHPHLAWSPDSRRVAFYGNLNREVEIGVVEVGGENELNQRFRTLDALTHDLTWMHDGKRLLFSMHSARYGRSLIFQLNVDSRDAPKIFPDSGTGMAWEDVCTSPTGRYIVATSGQ